MKTVIEGIEIMPAIAKTLVAWFEDAENCPPAPVDFINYLGEVQDCLCRALIDPSYLDQKSIKKSIENVICIKDNLRMFIEDTENDE